MQFLSTQRSGTIWTEKGNPDGGFLATVGLPKAVFNKTAPNIVGMTLVNAQAACIAAGLAMTATGDTTLTVVSQSPAALTANLPAGYTVVARFPQTIAMSFTTGFKQNSFS